MIPVVFPMTLDEFRIHGDDIVAIERASYPCPWSRGAFLEELVNPVSRLWGLLEEGQLWGYICFWLVAGEIHIMNVAVHQERRGRGFGSLLLNTMIEKGRSEGVESVWLEVRPSNQAARGMYEKAGFQEAARRRDYYTDNHEDAIIMALSLGSNPSQAHWGTRPALTVH